MHEFENEHETTAGPRSEATLGLVPVTLFSRLVAGAPFAAAWSAAVVVPLVRVVESDVPGPLFVLAMAVATITPALLYLRRHAMQASLRWDRETLTLLRGGRVALAIAWRDAVIRQRTNLDRVRIVEIRDTAGRTLLLATEHPLGWSVLEGRARIGRRDLANVLRDAAQHAHFDRTPLEPRRLGAASQALFSALCVCMTIALFAAASYDAPHLGAIAFACACGALLVDPARRLHRSLAHPVGRETLVIDLEERGRVRARRLDGSRVLLDLSTAQHPDALLPARRGFVNAILAVPNEASGTPYRSLEEPIPATFVETRDDRILRFEQLRAALVDVIGYGAFLATALAAALLPS